MRDLSAILGNPATSGASPWRGHEYAAGWGVFALPFDSGHILGLRVFRDATFGPYRSVWHRDPAGKWSIHVDGAKLETSCPRYYGAACAVTDFAHIDVAWTGPATVRVSMDAPTLEWTMTASTSPLLTVLNRAEAAMPLASWRPRALVKMRETLARTIGLGRVTLAGPTPSGHYGRMLPASLYFLDDSRATLDGVDLGRPARLPENPRIGGVSLPARGVLGIGMGMWSG